MRHELLCLMHWIYLTTSDTACLTGWTLYRDSCYLFKSNESDRMSWHEANASCKNLSASLVTITSQQETNTLVSFINGDHNHWIGLYKALDEEDPTTSVDWSWTDGTPYGWSNWNHETPACKRRHVQLEDQKWVDDDGTFERRYICEKNDGACTADWKKHNGRCYLIKAGKDDQVTWQNANISCSQFDADIASLTSEAETNYLTQLISDQPYWIGLYKSRNNATWIWADGSPYKWTNWAVNEPSCDHRYAQLEPNGSWSDESIDHKNRYICESNATRNTPLVEEHASKGAHYAEGVTAIIGVGVAVVAAVTISLVLLIVILVRRRKSLAESREGQSDSKIEQNQISTSIDSSKNCPLEPCYEEIKKPHHKDSVAIVNPTYEDVIFVKAKKKMDPYSLHLIELQKQQKPDNRIKGIDLEEGTLMVENGSYGHHRVNRHSFDT